MQRIEDSADRKLDLDFIWNGETYILRARSMEKFIISDSIAQNAPATLSGEVSSVAPRLNVSQWETETSDPESILRGEAAEDECRPQPPQLPL